MAAILACSSRAMPSPLCVSMCLSAAVQVSVYSVPAEKHLRTITLDRQHTHATTVVGLSFRWVLCSIAGSA